jgi:hypothetical protein
MVEWTREALERDGNLRISNRNTAVNLLSSKL